MKAFVAGIIAIATTTAAVGNSGQTMPEILVHMTKCGFACLPYAAKDAPCSTATDFDCICNGMGSLISGLTSCQHTISSCGSYADDSFDIGDALSDACMRYQRYATTDEIKQAKVYIENQIKAAQEVLTPRTPTSKVTATGPINAVSASASAVSTSGSAISASGSRSILTGPSSIVTSSPTSKASPSVTPTPSTSDVGRTTTMATTPSQTKAANSTQTPPTTSSPKPTQNSGTAVTGPGAALVAAFAFAALII